MEKGNALISIKSERPYLFEEAIKGANKETWGDYDRTGDKKDWLYVDETLNIPVPLSEDGSSIDPSKQLAEQVWLDYHKYLAEKRLKYIEANYIGATEQEDDVLHFTIWGTSKGITIGHFNFGSDKTAMYVHKDVDNVWFQYRGWHILSKGTSGGAGNNDKAFSVGMDVYLGHGMITNVHHFDNVEDIIDKASGVTVSGSYGSVGGSYTEQKSEGINGVVKIYTFTVSYGKSGGTGKMKTGSKGTYSVSKGIGGGVIPRKKIKNPSTIDSARSVLFNEQGRDTTRFMNILRRMDNKRSNNGGGG